MTRAFEQIEVDQQGDIFCVALRRKKMGEEELIRLATELNELLKDGCRKMVLSLGPEDPIMLYSVFLARLVSFQKRIREAGGSLKLIDVGPLTMEIFNVCRLVGLFDFYPSRQAAIAAFAK